MQKPTPAAANSADEDPTADSSTNPGGGGATTEHEPPQMQSGNTTATTNISINSSSNNNDNGSMPPQQVYVDTSNPNMAPGNIPGLEHQFHSLSFQPGGDGLMVDGGSDNPEDIDDQGGDGEDDPLKLFVGQVPKEMNEEDIFPFFDSYGPLKDVAIIRDKHTGLHRGCAFVTYWTRTDAERARESLHDQFTFPGGRRPAQVKPAEPSENKLFIGMLSRKAGDAEIQEIFAPYGEIKEIFMIRNQDGSSKCAAFLRYTKRESAMQAIEDLNGVVIMDGSSRPLIVKFADNKHQKQQRHMRNQRKHELMSMGMGPVAYGGYPHQVPPPMGMPHGGPQYPMPSQQYPPAYGTGNPPPPHGPPHPYMYAPQQYGQLPPYAYPNVQPDMRPPSMRPREGPAGANLFVYHLPHDLTDADLATAFNPFGNVVSAKVYVDKYTGESKGFGFVSYDSVMSAEAAIEQMNGFQIGNKRLKVQHKRVHSHGGVQNGFHPQQQMGSPLPQMQLQMQMGLQTTQQPPTAVPQSAPQALRVIP